MKSNYIVSFDYFRVFSIVIIVLGHSLSYEFQSTYPLLSNLVKGGGSLFFVFISGYLFCLLLPNYDNRGAFLKNKFFKLVVPYLIFSTPLVLYRHIGADSIFYHTEFGIPGYLYPIGSLMVGAHMTGYWYIPSIFLFFTLTFSYLKYFATSGAKYRYSIILIMSLVAIFIQRPFENFNPIHSLIYFSSFFFIGISFFIDKEIILKRFSNTLVLLTLLSLFIAINVIQSYFYHHIGNYHKDFFELNGLDWTFIKFLLITPFIFIVFDAGFKKNSLTLKYVAKISFLIYLLHPIVISALNISGFTMLSELYLGTFFSSMTTMFLAFFSCIAFHKLAVYIVGNKRLSLLGV